MLKSEIKCPGCGALAESQIYEKNDTQFEFTKCRSCRCEYGRLNGADHWLLLGTITEYGLKISSSIATLPVKGS
jgi:hypothetical protein